MESPEKRSVLSAGELLRDILTQNPEVRKITTRVFEVASPVEERLPYITIRLSKYEGITVKQGRGVETAIFEVALWTGTAESSRALAEAVRNALDGVGAINDLGPDIHRCTLADASQNVLASDPSVKLAVLDFEVCC